MYRNPLQLFILLLCAGFAGTAGAQEQDPRSGFGIEGNLLAGKIFKHSPKFTAPVPALSTAIDANFIWQTYGKKEWEQRRNFPVIGVGITCTDYGNNAVFGRAVGIYPNLQFRLARIKGMEWTFRMGDGLAYVTRKYQRTYPVDTVNTAIGSNLNDFAVLMTDLRYHFDDHWQFQFGLNLTHISNADTHQPNLGVNMVGIHMGVRYFPVTCKPKKIIKDLPKLTNQWLAQLRLGIGYQEAHAPGNPELPTYVASAYVSRRWLSKNKFYGGVDYAFHESTTAFLKWVRFYPGRERQNSWDGTFFVGNEFLVGRLGILAQLGYYYRQTYLKFDNSHLNEKLGVNYYVFKNEKGIFKELFISAMLATHTSVAEYAEFGIGTGF
jgi:lipid A 3-O-deacylase PagL